MDKHRPHHYTHRDTEPLACSVLPHAWPGMTAQDRHAYMLQALHIFLHEFDSEWCFTYKTTPDGKVVVLMEEV